MKLILLFCFFISISAMADCKYKLSLPMISYTVSDTNTTAPSDLSLTRSGGSNTTCKNFFLGFSKGRAGSYNRAAKNSKNSKVINYNLYSNNSSTVVLKNTQDITSPGETISGEINKDETKNLTFYFTLGPFGSKSPAAGTYYDVINVEANSGTFNLINSNETNKTLNIQIIVPKFTSLSLVDTGGVYDPTQTSKTLDFGELTTSEEMSFDLKVVSNAGYNIKVSSTNNGKLQRIGGSGSTSQINYNFYSNGSLIGLGSSSGAAVSIASGSGVTSSQGVNIPIRVVIGTVDSTKESGTYQDYITVTTMTTD